jgi:hypothetical protein
MPDGRAKDDFAAHIGARVDNYRVGHLDPPGRVSLIRWAAFASVSLAVALFARSAGDLNVGSFWVWACVVATTLFGFGVIKSSLVVAEHVRCERLARKLDTPLVPGVSERLTIKRLFAWLGETPSRTPAADR